MYQHEKNISDWPPIYSSWVEHTFGVHRWPLPWCPYSTFIHQASVASVTLMVVRSKEKCSELVLGPSRMGSDKGSLERWRKDEKRFGGNTRLWQSINETQPWERVSFVSKAVSKCHYCKTEMGFKGRDTKIEKSRAKIAHEQHGPMLRKKKEGNVNFLSFHLRVKRKGDEIENWGR